LPDPKGIIMKLQTAIRVLLSSAVCCVIVGCASNSRPTIRQRSVPIAAVQLTQPILITGNVIAPATAPLAVLKMTDTQASQSNLSVDWSWSTSPHSYVGDPVAANALVGLFIYKTKPSLEWHAFRVDSASSPQSTWAQRIQRFHDAYANGGIRDPGPRIFASGRWCIDMASASTADTGGKFTLAPDGLDENICVTIP
jgi:hypothetical protein